AGHAAGDDHHRRPHLAFDLAFLGDGQDGVGTVLGHDLAEDPAFDVEAAAETDVATDGGVRADQGFDGGIAVAGGFPVALAEHLHSPRRSAACQGKAWSTVLPSARNCTRTRWGVKPSGSMMLPSSCWK